MDNITEKLNNFTSLVLKDAEEKRAKLMENVEHEYSQRLEESETELLKDAYDNIQANIQDAKREANEQILHAQLDSKKRLIAKRSEIIDEVMKEAEAKLSEFSKSVGYEEWLVKKLRKALIEVGDGSKVVYVSEDDMRFADKLGSIPEAADFTVEASPDGDFVGGVKVFNKDRRVSVDYSFREMLSEERQVFLQSSGLSLD